MSAFFTPFLLVNNERNSNCVPSKTHKIAYILCLNIYLLQINNIYNLERSCGVKGMNHSFHTGVYYPGQSRCKGLKMN